MRLTGERICLCLGNPGLPCSGFGILFGLLGSFLGKECLSSSGEVSFTSLFLSSILLLLCTFAFRQQTACLLLCILGSMLSFKNLATPHSILLSFLLALRSILFRLLLQLGRRHPAMRSFPPRSRTLIGSRRSIARYDLSCLRHLLCPHSIAIRACCRVRQLLCGLVHKCGVLRRLCGPLLCLGDPGRRSISRASRSAQLQLPLSP
mmetsp:Transcript_47549/g.124621  ORF Transcript_47549/g.124621 Transcript_47549/m.124621 type:complete len:206 (-) Transcript_47549:962-1579(-)